MATKPKLLMQGSSWTVGAYKPSDTPNSDDLVPGGLAELLSADYDVTNISVQDDFNLGCVLRLKEHLSTHGPYDKLLICQNDPLRDLVVLRSTDHVWSRQFGLSMDRLWLHKVSTITKLLNYLTDKFYHDVAKLGIPTVLFAGPSKVNTDLAKKHRLTAIERSWTQVLVPEFTGSHMETSKELLSAAKTIQHMFPESALTIKQELCDYSDEISGMLNTWRKHPELFARHHPTALGNLLFYQHIREFL